MSARYRWTITAFAFLTFTLAGAGGALGQNTLYVSPTGSDTGLGTYGSPLATILEGVGRAGPGDTISLFDGTYSGAGNRDIVLPDFPLTIRSEFGDPELCTIYCGGSILGDHRAFRVNAEQDTTTVLRGLKITDGYVRTQGGAIYIAENSNILIEDCIFDDNYAKDSGGAVMKQGNDSGSSLRKPVFRRCIFRNNRSGEGGGLYVWFPCAAWIEDCEFDGNTAARGGGLFTYYASNVLIERTVFRNNVASEAGGAIDMSMEQYPDVIECTFEGNEAVLGGAIANRLGYSKKKAGEKSYGDFVECTFDGNTAEEGGAYYSYSQSAYAFRRCVFRNNFASVNGGAVKELYNGDSSFYDCLFVANTAGAGGAFFRDDMDDDYVWCSTRVHRCTLVGNGAFAGGAIAQTGVTTTPQYGDPSGYDVLRTIIAFGTGGAAIAVENGRAPQLECVDIYGNSGGDWTTPIFHMYGANGNIWEDPCFCDVATENYHLCGMSPCLPGAMPFGCDELIGAYDQGCGTPSGVDLPEAIPATHRLVGAHPNPFNPLTTVVYELPGPAVVTLKVFDPRGRLVQVLEDRRSRGPGRHEAVWRGLDLQGFAAAAGVYIVRMEAGEFAATERLTLLK